MLYVNNILTSVSFQVSEQNSKLSGIPAQQVKYIVIPSSFISKDLEQLIF